MNAFTLLGRLVGTLIAIVMFYYSSNGQQQGPISEEQLRQMLMSGTISAETLVWREGMTEWQSIEKVMPGLPGRVQCSVCGQIFAPDQTIVIGGKVVCGNCKPRFLQGMREGVVDSGRDKSLYAIALNQRRVILCFGLLLASNVGQASSSRLPVASWILSVAMLVTMIFSIIYVYRLAKALGFSALVYAIALIVPCLGLIILLVLVSRATAALRKGGVKVGLFGASPATIEQLRVT